MGPTHRQAPVRTNRDGEKIGSAWTCVLTVAAAYLLGKRRGRMGISGLIDMGISFSTSLIEGFGDRHFTEKNKKEKSEEERESGRKIEVSLLRQWRLGFSIDRPYRNLPPVPSLHLSPRPQNPNSKHFNSISAIFNSGSESCDGRAGKILRQFQFDAGEFFYSCWPFGCQEIVGKEVKTWNLVTYWG